MTYMQPLGLDRQPCGLPRVFTGTVERDGTPYKITGNWDLEVYKDINGVKTPVGLIVDEMPYYCRIWADDKSIVREINLAGPRHLRQLTSLTFDMFLTVLPRH